MDYIIVVAIILESILLAYTNRYQEATLNIGRAISPMGNDSGFQDAITPKKQTMRIICYFIGGIGIFIYSLIQFAWYWAFINVVIIVILSGIISAFLPISASAYFLNDIIIDMQKRHKQFSDNNDEMRKTLTEEILRRLLELNKDKGSYTV